MAPKRKRAEDGAAEGVTRATRASTRLKSNSSEPIAVQQGEETVGAGASVEPSTKKPKRASTKTANTKSRSVSQQVRDFLMMGTIPDEVGSSRSNGTSGSSSKSSSVQPSAPEPYSEARAKQLFKAYEDPDSPGEIGPEGFEKLCADLDISLEGALPLVLAWQLHGSEMAKFKEEEWMKGTGELRASTLQALSLAIRDLEDLLLLDKPPIQPPSGTEPPVKKRSAQSAGRVEPYSRQKYYQYAANREKAFLELYAFCFSLAKPPTGRNIDMDTASAFWSVLVAPKYPIMNDILKFIADKGTFKGVNKDLWNMTLEFCRTVQPDLSNYDPDGAWPTMLDDFVTWKKSSNSHPSGAQEEDQDIEIS